MDAEKAKALARLAIRRGSPEGQQITPCRCFRDNVSVVRSECYGVCGDAETAVALALRAAFASGQDHAVAELRKHAGAEAAARGIATDYVRHVQEAADWLATFARAGSCG